MTKKLIASQQSALTLSSSALKIIYQDFKGIMQKRGKSAKVGMGLFSLGMFPWR